VMSHERLNLASLPKQATRDAYGEELLALGQHDLRIVALDADLSGSTKSGIFGKACPTRFFNVGIAEQNMIGIAAGLAAAGKIPYASSFAIFVTGRAFEQVRQSVAYPRLPVRLVGSHAGVTVGPDGASHQAIEDIALMRVLPGMTVLVPADGVATKGLLQATLTLEGPAYLRLGRASVPTLYGPQGLGRSAASFVPGGSHVLLHGQDVTIVACGVLVAQALEAAYQAADEGLSVGVIDAYSIKPLDTATILSAARESGALVTAEEHSVIGGLGSAVAEVTAANWPVPVVRIGLQDRFGESGEPDELLEACGLTAPYIRAAVDSALELKRQRSG
jgi:transketolase